MPGDDARAPRYKEAPAAAEFDSDDGSGSEISSSASSSSSADSHSAWRRGGLWRSGAALLVALVIVGTLVAFWRPTMLEELEETISGVGGRFEDLSDSVGIGHFSEKASMLHRRKRRRQKDESPEDPDGSAGGVPAPAPYVGDDVPVGNASAGAFISQCEAWNGGLGENPVFHNREELVENGWGPYFENVYGQVPTTRYPICIGSLWFVHRGAVKKAEIFDLELQKCPKKPGDFYMTNNKYQPAGASWIFHPPPYGVAGARGLPGDTWVEVTHCSQKRESSGSWFMFAMGSGIWFNTGRTIVFDDHAEAHLMFCGPKCRKSAGDVAMSAEAAKQGYDTIQFLAHPDNQWRCNRRGQTVEHRTQYKGAMNIEIVGVKLHGGGACGNDAFSFRTGWNADRPCDCNNDASHLNCNGVGVGLGLGQESTPDRDLDLE